MSSVFSCSLDSFETSILQGGGGAVTGLTLHPTRRRRKQRVPREPANIPTLTISSDRRPGSGPALARPTTILAQSPLLPTWVFCSLPQRVGCRWGSNGSPLEVEWGPLGKVERTVGPGQVAQLVGAWSRTYTRSFWVQSSVRAHALVVGSIPSRGMYRRQLINVSLSHQCFSLPLPLSLKTINVSLGEDFFKKGNWGSTSRGPYHAQVTLTHTHTPSGSD